MCGLGCVCVYVCVCVCVCVWSGSGAHTCECDPSLNGLKAVRGSSPFPVEVRVTHGGLLKRNVSVHNIKLNHLGQRTPAGDLLNEQGVR